jgi:hypothetical protein
MKGLYGAGPKKLVGMKMDGWTEDGVGVTKDGQYAVVTNVGRVLYCVDDAPASAGTLKVRIHELEASMQEFVDRCDAGEVRSVKTYTKFKALLAKAPEVEAKTE